MTKLEQINANLMARLESFVRELIPNGNVEGDEYSATNPTRSDSRPGSFKVNLRTCVWKDFAVSDKGGNDPISLYAYCKGITNKDAFNELAADANLLETPAVASARPNKDAWVQVVPAPADAPSPPAPRGIRWTYRDIEGRTIGFIDRVDHADGKKDILPLTWCRHADSGDEAWRRKGFPEPRPLYGLWKLAGKDDAAIMIVEGEKTADAAQELCPWAVVLSWPGGAQAVKKADWTAIRKRRIAIWPDADKAGLDAAVAIAEILIATNEVVKIVRNPPGVPEGWDLADAVGEMRTPEWTKEWIKENFEEYHSRKLDEKRAIVEEARDARELRSIGEQIRDKYGSAFLRSKAFQKHSVISKCLAEVLRDRFMFDPESETWFSFDKVWREAKAGDVKRIVIDLLDFTTGDFGYTADKVSGTIPMLATRLSGSARGWNTNRNLIPMSNGVLDLTTRKLIAHDPSLMLRWHLPAAFDPEATCPTIDSVIKNIAQGNDNTERTIIAYLGAILYGMASLQKYLEVVGKPGSGKSSLMKIAKALVGSENIVTTTMKQLADNKFETASLQGKRLAIVPDADTWVGSIEVFKSITGQDPIRFERKGKDVGEAFIFDGMVIVSANSPLQFTDSSTAMKRRRIPIHIDKLFDAKKIDPFLDEKIVAEIPGLMNKLLAMPIAEIRAICVDQSGTRSGSDKRALVETNIVAAWVNERLVVAEGVKAKIGDLQRDRDTILHTTEWLFPNFVAWAEAENRRQAISNTKFSETVIEVLQSCGIDVEKRRTSKGVHLQGVRLRRLWGPKTEQDIDAVIPTLLTGAEFEPEPDETPLMPAFRNWAEMPPH